MKKLVTLFMAVLCIVVFSVPALAADKSEQAASGISIDYWNTSEQRYIVGDVEYIVLPSESAEVNGSNGINREEGVATASKNVVLRDAYSNATLGTICIHATFVYDGNYVSASSWGSYIVSKPASSDLKITGTTISGNGSTRLIVTSNFTFTSSKGTAGGGFAELCVNGNGSYY